LNKITLAGAVWIASDIHLGPATPATSQAFQLFLSQARAQADALILCGDIFDAWIGDDYALTDPPIWLDSTLDMFRQVSEKIPLWLGRGNRDFLMGAALAGSVGAQLLPDAVRLETDCGPVLLSHGDEYCTDDIAYQRFRGIVRRRAVQRLFLSLSLKTRRRIADWARSRSMMANRNKSTAIMDVNQSAIDAAIRNSGLTTLVHGHTHQPAVHHFTVDERNATRIVLPDWDYDHSDPPRGGWLVIDERGLRLEQNPAA
jgi:UDP-2,3-diacylglucosamine hydrolase